MKNEKSATVVVDTEISYLDALQVVISNLLVDAFDRKRSRISRPTQNEVRGWVKGEIRQLGKTAGVRAQLIQMELHDKFRLSPQDYQLVRNTAQEVTARSFKWHGELPERWSVRVRVEFHLDEEQLVRLIAARVLGWMIQRRDRERRDDWYRVNWWSGLTKRMTRRYVRSDLIEYGLDALNKADHQVKLCSDSITEPGFQDLPRHVHEMSGWRVRRAFDLGVYS